MLTHLLPLFAPIILIGAAVLLHLGPHMPARRAAVLSERASLLALIGAIASLVALIVSGVGDSPLLGVAGIGLSARVDAVSISMLLLVTFIGWVVVRYARIHLDGEARQTCIGRCKIRPQ